jgi:hypothetical protein
MPEEHCASFVFKPTYKEANGLRETFVLELVLVLENDAQCGGCVLVGVLQRGIFLKFRLRVRGRGRERTTEPISRLTNV